MILTASPPEAAISVLYDHRSHSAGSANTMLAAERTDLAILPPVRGRAEGKVKTA